MTRQSTNISVTTTVINEEMKRKIERIKKYIYTKSTENSITTKRLLIIRFITVS